MEKCPLSVIVLTFNEEVNLRACLESVKDLTDEIFIVDSFSTDKTQEIAREYTEKFYQNPWTHGAAQRDWALRNLPFTHAWILFLDADERLTPALRKEIDTVIRQEMQSPRFGGFYVPRKFFFLGKQLRWGGCRGGLKEMRLCHRQYLDIKERAGREIYVSLKKVSSLKEYIIHNDQKPLAAWIDRHNCYSSQEGEYLWKISQAAPRSSLGRQIAASDRRLYWKEVFRERIWHRMPLGFRPTLMFLYNYFIRLGFLDGKAGFVYHFLHNYWYRFLIDAKYYEIKTIKKLTL